MSEMNPAIVAGTRIAVDLLTVWTEQNQVSAVNHVDAVLNDPNGPGAPIIVVGQLTVGAALVVMLAQAHGAVTANEIMAMAGEILRGLARDAAAM
jgi:hypothetical protein